MKKNINLLLITIYLIYCAADYRIEITSLNGAIQEPFYLYLTDINSKVMSDILKDSFKVQLNFKMLYNVEGKYFFVKLNDIQIKDSQNDQLYAGDLYLDKIKSDPAIYLGICIEDMDVDRDYIRNKIGRVKNFEDLESLFNKTKSANNGIPFMGNILAQSYLEIIPFTINLAINNCFGQSGCPNEYEIGVNS